MKRKEEELSLDCVQVMSGSGRKTHYRKSVTEEFLNGLPVPEENEVVCRTHGSRGTNIFEVIFF